MRLRRLGEVMVGHADFVTGLDGADQIVEQWAEFQVYDIIVGPVAGGSNESGFLPVQGEWQAAVLQFMHFCDAGIGSEKGAHAGFGDPFDFHVLPEFDP